VKSSHQPTPSELEILDILWDRGSGTVREVFEEIAGRRQTTYTTVLKFMQIMQEKGLVARDESERAHVYRPAQTRRQMQKKLVGSLLDRAFRGSALGLVQHVLETKPASKEELDEIRKMIDAAEAKGGKR
jgi:BlaI family transcriptional regulator, penicillinase repressor